MKQQKQPREAPEIETDFIGENLQYPGIIMRQVDRIGQLTMILGRVDNVHASFAHAVKLLQSELDPYTDEKYIEDKKEIYGWSNEFYNKNIKNKSPIDVYHSTPVLNISQAMLLFSALMGLAARRGLGLEQDVSGEVKSQ